MENDKDFLDEIIDESSREDSAFPRLVEAAYRRRQLLKALGETRRKLRLSQTTVAARMGTSQSQLVRLEAGEADPRLSTLERYAAALGQAIEWRVAERRGGLAERHRASGRREASRNHKSGRA